MIRTKRLVPGGVSYAFFTSKKGKTSILQQKWLKISGPIVSVIVTLHCNDTCSYISLHIFMHFVFYLTVIHIVNEVSVVITIASCVTLCMCHCSHYQRLMLIILRDVEERLLLKVSRVLYNVCYSYVVCNLSAYVCTYVCTYVCMRLCVCMCVCMCICCMYVCVLVRKFVLHLCVCVSACVCICVYTYMCVFVCVSVYVCPPVYLCVCNFIYSFATYSSKDISGSF